MSEEALRLIAENQLTQNPELDLSRCDLAHLPEQLEDCTWLQALNLKRDLQNSLNRAELLARTAKKEK